MKINFNVNVVVKNLTLADLCLIGGWGFIVPILPIFVINNVADATLATVGVAIGIHWLVRSLVHIPLGEILDRIKGEKDDFYTLIAGLILAGFSAFALMAVSEIWFLYIVQAISGIAFGIYIPAWRGIFSRHLDEGRYSFNWSLNSTAVGLGTAAAAFLSGSISAWLGFQAVFAIMGVFSFIAVFIVLAIPEISLPRQTTEDEKVMAIRNHHTSKGI